MNNYIARLNKQSASIFAAIPLCVLSMAEIVFGTLQWIGIIQSNHRDYPFTGTFYNPGPYACYLAVIIPVIVFLLYRYKLRKIQYFGISLLYGGIILITDSLSRTAIAAALLGSIIALSEYTGKNIHKKRISYFVIGLMISTIIGTSLYMIKKDSADGRFLIWNVATQAVKDVPLNGVGWDNVAGTYGETQEIYFASREGSEQEIMVADAPEYVFNEYLQIAIAFGSLAAMAMIAIIGSAFAVALKSKSYGFAGSVAAIAIVMFASYPLQFPLFVVTISIVLIGCFLSAKSLIIKLAGFGIVALSTILFLYNDDRTDVNSSFQIAHSLHQQRDYAKSNEMLLDIKQKSSDPMILNIIGKNYQSLGMVDSAAYYLNKSTFRCPNRMYPHYLLMKLYNDPTSFNRELCRKEAEKILSMKVKIESPAINDMRREAHLILNGSDEKE